MTNRMIMGSTDREVDLTSSSKLIFNHADISFQSIATYLTALYGFIGLIDLYKPDEKGGHSTVKSAHSECADA